MSFDGGVSEWFKEPVLKTGDSRKGTVGSNPTPSAIKIEYDVFGEVLKWLKRRPC